MMNDPIVSVKEGKLRGKVEQIYEGTSYYSFKGIPYAEPPIGKLRFRAALPPKPWEGIYDATKHGPVCPQYDIFTKKYIEGDESCLFLNVYTRSLDPASKTPVIVYIHGGACMSGSGNDDMHGPDFLIQHDVILVTINYRLEVLGFLCLDTPEVPGNAGMKDQVAALQWVKQNIAQFGGDPDNVTISGISAGSFCVTYHMISPMSKGLFHKCIVQSSVCSCEWALGTDMINRALRLGKLLGKTTENIQELMEFLQEVPAFKFAGTTFITRTLEELYQMPLFFLPVVEKFSGESCFLDEHPLDMILSGKIQTVPLIIGNTSCEGIVRVNNQLRYANFINKNLKYLVPTEIAAKVSENKRSVFGKRIKEFYFGDNDICKERSQQLANLQSELRFSHSIHRFCNLYSAISNQPIYKYRFCHETDLNGMKVLSDQIHLKGAGHVDDWYYLFRNNWSQKILREQPNLRKVIYRYTQIWANFVKTGNPTPDDSDIGIKWEPYTRLGKESLDIDQIYKIQNNVEKEKMSFWDKLYQEAGCVCTMKSNCSL